MQTKHFTGIVKSARRIEWTVMRQSNVGLEVAEHDSSLFPASADDGPEAVPAGPRDKGTVCAAIPISEALVRVLDLPATDMGELAGMVDLQVGKISPFPVDELVVSFEVLAREENSTRVLIAAVPRKLLEGLRSDGIHPRHVDIDLLGWWYAIRQHAEGEGRIFNIVLSEGHAGLAVSENGVPILFRSVMQKDELDVDEFLSGIAEELQYTLIAIEADWGEGLEAHIALFSDEADIDRIAVRMSELSNLPVEKHNLDELPPLSELIVRRRSGRTEACIDLVPPEWIQTARDVLLKRRLLALSGALVVVWFLAVGAIMGYGAWERSSMSKLETRAEALKEPALKSRRLQMRIGALEQYADRTRSVLECLREVSVLLPARLELQSFSFKKNREVALRGLSATTSATEIYTFFQALENSDKFEELQDQRVSTVTRRGSGRASQFQVTLLMPQKEEAQ